MELANEVGEVTYLYQKDWSEVHPLDWIDPLNVLPTSKRKSTVALHYVQFFLMPEAPGMTFCGHWKLWIRASDSNYVALIGWEKRHLEEALTEGYAGKYWRAK